MPFVKRNLPNVLQVISPILSGRPVTIIPGVNSLTDDELVMCKANKGFMSCVKNGVIELMDEPSTKAGTAKSGIEAIKVMKVTEAKKLIKSILNKKDLDAIKEADKRSGIQNAVDTQLDKLKIDNDSDEDEE